MTTVNYVSLPLFPDPDYNYTVALEGNSYNIRITYNERTQLWFMALSDADSNLLLSSIGLVPNYTIMFDYVVSNLTGYFWVQEKANITAEAYKIYPDAIDQYYDFYYIYYEG